MFFDTGQQLIIPSEIVVSAQRPDLVLWSTTLRIVYFIELKVPWEKAVIHSAEIGCRALSLDSNSLAFHSSTY